MSSTDKKMPTGRTQPLIDEERGSSVMASITERRIFSGPLPPADELAAYERVLSGAAERIFVMAETQQLHRINYEAKALAGHMRERLISQVFAAILAILTLALAFVAADRGWETLAIVLASSTIGSVVAAFLYQNKRRQKSKEE